MVHGNMVHIFFVAICSNYKPQAQLYSHTHMKVNKQDDRLTFLLCSCQRLKVEKQSKSVHYLEIPMCYCQASYNYVVFQLIFYLCLLFLV